MRKLIKKKHLGTSKLADLFGMTRLTIKKWIDKGWIEGYLTIGGTARISVKELIEQMEKNNMPIPLELKNYLGYRVLIIHDDCKKTEHLFPKDKYIVYTAFNGFDGCIKLGNVLPDILLVDFSLPFINSIEFVKGIKRSKYLNDLEIIAIDNSICNSEKEILRSAGVKSFLQFPIDDKILSKTLNSLQ